MHVSMQAPLNRQILVENKLNTLIHGRRIFTVRFSPAQDHEQEPVRCSHGMDVTVPVIPAKSMNLGCVSPHQYVSSG
jgi:hypothetical protein